MKQTSELPKVNLQKPMLEASKSDTGNGTNKRQARPKSSNQVSVCFFF